jgi:anti-sigma regulatory factor (Ser/Thr protein kinase)
MSDAAGFLMRESWRPDVVSAHRLELAGGPFAAARARAHFSELMGDRLDEDDLFDVSVLLSELVTNAVRHAGADEYATVIVHLAIAPDVLRVEVCDEGPGFDPRAITRPRTGVGGNGLLLVDQLSSSWGVAADDGTCVWFERTLLAAAA